MPKTSDSCTHLVEYDSDERKILIYRIFQDGSKVFYTEISIPPASDAMKSVLDDVFSRLGEAIIIDSREMRSVLNL